MSVGQLIKFEESYLKKSSDLPFYGNTRDFLFCLLQTNTMCKLKKIKQLHSGQKVWNFLGKFSTTVKCCVVMLLSFFLVFYSVRVNWRLFHAPQTKVILSKPDVGWLELQRSKKPGIFTQDALGSLLWPSVDMRSNLITSGILRWFLAGIFLTLCSPKNSYVTYVMFCWLI